MRKYKINFGQTGEDYARHRAGFPDALFGRLQADYQVGLPGQRILDVGTGTGSLARGLALRGAHVIAADPSTALLHHACTFDAQANVQVHYVRATAENTPLPSAHFDVVTAGQCWHWLDRPAAAQETWRLLGRGGTLVITHFDWIALPGNVAQATEQLIRDYNPNWNPDAYQLTQQGLYPAWLYDVGAAGYHSIETFSFDVDVQYTHEAWRGRVRASAGVSASMTPDVVVQFDSALKDMLWMSYAADPMPVPHRVWALVCRK